MCFYKAVSSGSVRRLRNRENNINKTGELQLDRKLHTTAETREADYALDYMPCNSYAVRLRLRLHSRPMQPHVPRSSLVSCVRTNRAVHFLISFGQRPSGGTAHGAGARPAARGAAARRAGGSARCRCRALGRVWRVGA